MQGFAYTVPEDTSTNKYLSGSELVTSGVYWTHFDSRNDVSTSETASATQLLSFHNSLAICKQM